MQWWGPQEEAQFDILHEWDVKVSSIKLSKSPSSVSWTGSSTASAADSGSSKASLLLVGAAPFVAVKIPM